MTKVDYFEGLDGSNILKNSLNARRIRESSNLESIENIIHLDAKTSFIVLIMVAIDADFIKFSEQ